MKKKKYSGVLVKHEDQVLLCKRNNEGSLPGEWSIPGGKIEKEETPIDGAVREFYEETHLEITKPLTFCGVLKRYTRSGDSLKGHMFTFLMEVENKIFPNLEEASDGDEHSQCGYFKLDDLPQPLGEELKKLIETVLK
jgi:8-oxo-dGTP diphosphatase